MSKAEKTEAKKSLKLLIGLLAVIGILVLAWIVMLIINIYNYIYPTANSYLTEEEQAVLAVEFELEGVTDKISAANYTDDCFRLEVEYFETCEEMFDCLEFKSETMKNTALELVENADNGSWPESYKNLEYEEINVLSLPHARFFEGEQDVTIHLFHDENGYGFIAEKMRVINGEALAIAQGR